MLLLTEDGIEPIWMGALGIEMRSLSQLPEEEVKTHIQIAQTVSQSLTQWIPDTIPDMIQNTCICTIQIMTAVQDITEEQGTMTSH